MITNRTRQTAAHPRFRRVFAYLLLAVSLVLGMLTVATTTASAASLPISVDDNVRTGQNSFAYTGS